LHLSRNLFPVQRRFWRLLGFRRKDGWKAEIDVEFELPVS